MAKTRTRRGRSVRRTTRARKYISKRKAVRRAKNSNLVRKIKQVVTSITEKKQAYHTTGNSLVKFNSGIDSVGDMIRIVPDISQGVQEHQRIGDQIRASNLNVKGYIKLDLNDVADSTKLPNVIVRMMIVSMKCASGLSLAQANYSRLDTLLQKGGTTTGFTGSLQDLYAPINRDVFTVHYEKKFYLSQSFLNSTGPSAPSQYVSQDISKTLKFFNINVKCKNRVFKYDEDQGVDLQPTNFAPFLLLGYSYADGSAADVIDTKVGLCFDSTLNYTDA